MNRSARVVLLLAASVMLAACGALTKLVYSNATLAYSNLAPMATWMVDDYVDLSDGQKDWVRERITRVMQWHRSTELPQYRRFLERVLRESEEPFTVQEIGEAYADLRLAYHRMAEQLIPDVADFLVQLDHDQLAQMQKRFADDNRKFVKESTRGTAEERREQRIGKMVQHMEGWLGEVNEAQRKLIEERYQALPEYVEERLADRKYRQAEMLELLRARAGKEAVAASLRKLLIDTDTWRRPEYLKRMRDRDQRMFELFAALSATLTPEQRAHMQGRIKRYMRDINTLTAGSTRGGG
ncbi:MAG TPA: DUF6279 family lipoprotein [Usitatibacter sp.]|nr:DUF6279 family lipoprotein [Usitatibacter sp.]